MLLDILIIGGLIALTVGILYYVIRARERQEQRDADALAEAKAKNLHIPQSLHPVIDPDICIGSLSCLKVCPEGDILGVQDGKAVLINAAACIGHGKCALECPVDAIKLVFGSSERGMDLPEVNEFFESSRAGIHVVGELGGMGLIRNAIVQGVQCSEFLADRLAAERRSDGDGETVDVAIVGAGPAGMATALGCMQAGLSHRVLEQGALGGTIANYPRQKIVMTERVDLPLFGKFGKKFISKEELLETFGEIVGTTGVQVEEGIKVTSIEGLDGDFTVQTTQGAVKARKVVLATGRRGSPRKLGVPGEELPKVSYSLLDPEQYEGTRVLVVGGGDSALECAIALATETDAEVTLSYRNAELARARDANKKKFYELVDKGAIKALMPSTVMHIDEGQVLLSHNGKRIALENDFVLVNIGGELPTEFLSSSGVGLKRYYGNAPGEENTEARARVGSAKQNNEQKRHRRFVLTLFAIGLVILAVLTIVGLDYYKIPVPERHNSPLHKMLRPAGTWGHGVGIVATLFMMSNFLYVLRKRWRLFKGTGSIRRWLTFHQFVGFMSPTVIAFHAAFQSNNIIASSTAISLAVVVLTGIVGRFIFGLVPSSDGRTAEYSEVLARWERLKSRIEPMLEDVREAARVRALLVRATAPANMGFFTMLATIPAERARNSRDLGTVRELFPDGPHFRQFKDAFQRLVKLRTQVNFYKSLKRLLSVWRALHVVLAILLVVMIAAHISVSLYLGYKWIFR